MSRKRNFGKIPGEGRAKLASGLARVFDPCHAGGGGGGERERSRDRQSFAESRKARSGRERESIKFPNGGEKECSKCVPRNCRFHDPRTSVSVLLLPSLRIIFHGWDGIIAFVSNMVVSSPNLSNFTPPRRLILPDARSIINKWSTLRLTKLVSGVGFLIGHRRRKHRERWNLIKFENWKYSRILLDTFYSTCSNADDVTNILLWHQLLELESS